jgi:anaerobic ribonucleoside-triphosphate reductase activating protein
MRYAQIRSMDISNGVGIACSLFVQGCSHHCKNCFNPETWDFDEGKEWTKETEDMFISLCKNKYVDCVSILGGEPFDQDIHIYHLLKRLRTEIGKPIYVWTGYTIEQLINIEIPYSCLKDNLIDYLIDGEYIDELRNLNLELRGSSNQRIINVKEWLNEL